ncbi:hypothetical protein Q7C_412 [Methylophaga frappieri]|uniref:Dicarboxylate transport domain-containing protein n=1 Tax=Methylophaga frappieri (strain ATCC BAA-2434 / DSM 25690 / JAM7) TaxID=754477 RepID=I1YF94_METFJ|nr:hypothetical protein [Methylophaga frappieri]AFJ01587.1 hypothetical protein Q7C_412 [Methylophaga frappieri]
MTSGLCRLLSVILLLGLSALPAKAIDTIQIQLESLALPEGSLQGLSVGFEIVDQRLLLQVELDQLQLAGQSLKNLALNCANWRYAAEYWHCDNGDLAFEHTVLGVQKLSSDFSFNLAAQHYDINLKAIRIGNGRVDVDVQSQAGQWQLNLVGDEIGIAAVLDMAQGLVPDIVETVKRWQPSGTVKLQAAIQGQETRLLALDMQLNGESVHFSDESGNQVGEALVFQLEMDATETTDTKLQIQTDLMLSEGQTYFAPVFLDFSEAPLSLSSNTMFDFAAKEINSAEVNVLQQDVLTVAGQLGFQDNALIDAEMDWQSLNLAALYQWWIQPFLTGSAAGQLELDGAISGKVQWQPEQIEIAAQLDDLDIQDKQDRFAMQSLSGQVGWQNTGQLSPVELRWQSAAIGPIPIGESQLSAIVSNQEIQLTSPLVLPLFDGALQIDHFVYDQSTQQNHWQFSGELTPISMAPLTTALGWPEMQGKLAGVIPEVRYANQQIEVDGALQVNVFDGRTIIRDLRLQSPFGSLPQLTANIDFQQLDLEMITQVFEFGRITGRLAGYVHDLRLSDWQPVAFDAALMTPESNPGKRRISQRAVDNLTQIGGGASGALSRSFLSVFEDFSYEKLGLSCRLQNQVCKMNGVETDEQGYYIVKAGGLPPWINVRGFTRQVDWPDLLNRLQAVRNSEGPVIQ